MKGWNGYQKGVNLGGWLSQYPVFSEEHFGRFITREDIARIAGMGFDHVRLPVDYSVIEQEDGSVREEGYAHIADCLEWCRLEGLHLLLDLHETYGYSFDPLKPMDRERFFYDEALQERFLRLWETIARRLGAEREVAFELLNEVVLEGVAQAWNDLAGKAIGRIRAIAPETTIVVGGVNYNNVKSVAKLSLPADPHLVYNFHCYEPLIFTHQGAYWVEGMPADFRIGYPMELAAYRKESAAYAKELMGAVWDPGLCEAGPEMFRSLFADAVKAAEAKGVALYCGEYGVIELAPKEDTKRWLADIHQVFAEYGIGHAIWNYKNKDFGIIDSDYGF